MANPPAPPPIPPHPPSRNQPRGPSSTNPQPTNQTPHPQNQLKTHNPINPTATHPASGATGASYPSSRGPQSANAGEKISYANIVRDPSGPSFIRAHTKEVAAFGALPDIAAEPRISSIGGEPVVNFSHEELKAAEDIFKDAIVIKFLSGRPTWEACHATVNSWGLKQEFIMGPLDSKSILLRFRDHSDMLAVLARESTYIKGFPYRAYRWNRLYNVKEDAAFAPVWVSFPRLPIPFYIPSMLRGIAKSIGNVLCFDRATTLMTRASAARVCIEVDLRKKLPSHVWIGVHGKFQQPIIYEKLPKFCNFCKIQGHSVEECKKIPIDKSNPVNHGVYEPLIHNGNATPMGLPPNTNFVVTQAGPEGTVAVSKLGQSKDIIAMSTGEQEQVAEVHNNHDKQLALNEKSSNSNQQENINDIQGAQHSDAAPVIHPRHQAPLSENLFCNDPSRSDMDGLNACRTDLMNQHPPILPAGPSQAAPPSSTPSVQHNAATTSKSADIHELVQMQAPCDSRIRRSKTKKAKAIAFKERLNEGDEDEFWVKAHKKAKAIKQKQVQEHENVAQQGEDGSSETEPPPPQDSAAKDTTNSFAALQDGQEDDDDRSVTIESCDSDTDEGLVEPLDVSHHSADDSFISLGRKTKSLNSSPNSKKNIRYPNGPLNVQLRVRKGSSHPSP